LRFRTILEFKKLLQDRNIFDFGDLDIAAFGCVFSQVRDCPAVPRPASMDFRFRRKHRAVNELRPGPHPFARESAIPAARRRRVLPGRGWM
jgi:hypothetical protein